MLNPIPAYVHQEMFPGIPGTFIKGVMLDETVQPLLETAESLTSGMMLVGSFGEIEAAWNRVLKVLEKKTPSEDDLGTRWMFWHMAHPLRQTLTVMGYDQIEEGVRKALLETRSRSDRHGLFGDRAAFSLYSLESDALPCEALYAALRSMQAWRGEYSTSYKVLQDLKQDWLTWCGQQPDPVGDQNIHWQEQKQILLEWSE